METSETLPRSARSFGSERSTYFEAKEQDSAAASLEEEEVEEELTEEQQARQAKLDSKWFITRFRQRAGDFVNHKNTQLVVICLIVINAIMMGIGTFDFVTTNASVERAFEITDQVFLVIFSIELLLQLIYLDFRLFLDGWLVFDFIIIVLSWAFSALQVIRAFRIFRAFRLITRIKTLRDLVSAIVAVLPRMGAIFCLLLLIFYIFGVLFTELFKDLDLSDNYFRTLDASLFTCFEMMTLEWADLARECMDYYDWAWAPFIFFIAISGFIVFNLIIAVVCDAVAVAEERARRDAGIDYMSPEEKIHMTQERIHVLGNRINGMLHKQNDMQDLLHTLASEIHELEGDTEVLR